MAGVRVSGFVRQAVRLQPQQRDMWMFSDKLLNVRRPSVPAKVASLPVTTMSANGIPKGVSETGATDLQPHQEVAECSGQIQQLRETFTSLELELYQSDAATIEDKLFDIFKDSHSQRVSVVRFMNALAETGIRRNDPRLEECVRCFREYISVQPGHEHDGVSLDREQFRACLQPSIMLISQAFRDELIIPEWTKFSTAIEEIFWECTENTSGKVANYIPQLARYSPNYWGACICSIDGQRFSIGDVQIPFCLQSVSKPFAYAIALHDLGTEVVHNYVGLEPSGRGFNDINLDYNDKPHNPMVNSGAIVIASLLQKELKLADRFDYLFSFLRRIAGGEYLGYSNATFLSEREAADRNYALGYYLRENKCFPEKSDLKETMDFYFQLCSCEVTCESLSVMAATLANGGICPISGEVALDSTAVTNCLSLMYSCGMYDYSGQFAFQVGLPGKSGVSGGMMIVVPNVMGIALWSPALDNMGNSCRGIQFAHKLVEKFNFHNYDNLRHTVKKWDPRKHAVEVHGTSVVTLLFGAARGDITSIRRDHLSGVDMKQADYDGRTALHLAAAEGHLEVVKFLVEKSKVPLDPKDRWGHTPMDDAKRFEHKEVVAYFEKVEDDTHKENENCAKQKLVSVEDTC